MDKPADMFDRDHEWSALTRFVTSGLPHATLGTVSGRRRQGKTFLLEALCEAAGGFYFAAEQAAEAESLRHLSSAVGEYLGSDLPIHFTDWRQAVDALLSIGRDRQIPIVIDEFPYLASASPSLPSVIQAALAPRRKQRLESRSRILLCGSALSFMGSLLSGEAPLRGRAGLELVVPTLDYRAAARFWDVSDPALALRLHAVVGGTPAYRREFVENDTPATTEEFDAWALRTVLNPSSPLFREARYLLSVEPGIRDVGLYHSVLAAVAWGNHTGGGIASYVGRPAGDISHHLGVLEDCGLLRREHDAFRRNRSLYRINEPLISFYHAVLRPDWSDWEHGRDAERLWLRRRNRFTSNVLGPHFEQICRDWARWFADDDLFGGHVSRVGSGLVNDPKNRTGHEVDIVVFGESDEGSAPLLSLGEAKWNEVMGLGHLERLRDIRSLLTASGRFDTSQTKLACYSGRGFMPALREAADNREVTLIGPEQLYGLSA